MYTSTSDPVISKHHEQRMQKERAARASRARIVESVHNGSGTKSLVLDALKRRYHPDTWAQMKLSHEGVLASNRLMHDVLDKVNIETDAGMTLGLSNGEKAVEGEEAERFESFKGIMGYEQYAKTMTRGAWLHDAICAMPTCEYSPRVGKRLPGRVIYTPEHFDLEPNPRMPTDYVALCVYGEKDDEHKTKTKTRWTSDHWVEYEQDRHREGMWVEVDSGAHDYGTIPAEILVYEPSVSSPWGHSYGEWLTDVTVEANQWETFLSVQGSTQVKVVAGTFKNAPQGQVVAPGGTLVALGDTADADVIDLQTDVARMREVYVKDLRRQVAVSLGLHADEFDIVGTPPSGEALKMRKWSVEQMAVPRRQRFSDFLRRLYWLDLRFFYYQLRYPERHGEYKGKVLPIKGLDGNYAGDLGSFVPPLAQNVLPPYAENVAIEQQPYRLSVSIHETVYPELAAEREAREQYEMRNGFKSPAQVYREKYPDAGDDDAEIEKKMRTNLQQYARMQKDVHGARGSVPLVKPNGPGLPNA